VKAREITLKLSVSYEDTFHIPHNTSSYHYISVDGKATVQLVHTPVARSSAPADDVAKGFMSVHTLGAMRRVIDVLFYSKYNSLFVNLCTHIHEVWGRTLVFGLRRCVLYTISCTSESYDSLLLPSCIGTRCDAFIAPIDMLCNGASLTRQPVAQLHTLQPIFE